MTNIKITCPHCAQHLEAPDEMGGQTVVCPACQKQMTLPLPSALPPPILAMNEAQRMSSTSPTPTACPLCGDAKHMRNARLLYEHLVCRKCHAAFANRRQLAYAIDAILLNALLLIPFVNIVVVLIYAGKDCFAGQSIGKAMCGVKVINSSTGEAGGFGMSFKRNLPLYIPVMPLVVGFSLGKGFRIGDGWAHSRVIWKKYETNPVFASARTDQ